MLKLVLMQIIHMDFLPLQACGRSLRGLRLCDFTCRRQLIDWLQVNHLKFPLLISYKRRFSNRTIYSKKALVVVTVWWLKTVAGIRVIPRVNNAHLVNTSHFFNSLYVSYSFNEICWFMNTIIRQDIFIKGYLYQCFIYRDKCKTK